MTQREAVEIAKAIYQHHRRSEINRKRSVRQPTWDELEPSVRAKKIEQAKRAVAQYARSDAREVRLTP